MLRRHVRRKTRKIVERPGLQPAEVLEISLIRHGRVPVNILGPLPGMIFHVTVGEGKVGSLEIGFFIQGKPLRPVFD